MSMHDGLLMEREHGLIHTSSPAIITWKQVVASCHLVAHPVGRAGFIYHLHLTLWVSCDELPDLLVLTPAQAELGSCDRLFHLAGMTSPGNRSTNPRIVDCPGDGHNTLTHLILPTHPIH